MRLLSFSAAASRLRIAGVVGIRKYVSRFHPAATP